MQNACSSLAILHAEHVYESPIFSDDGVTSRCGSIKKIQLAFLVELHSGLVQYDFDNCPVVRGY